MEEKRGIVYLVTNQTNKKVYVGQTRSSLAKRWSQHKSDAKVGRNEMILHKAMRKYGHENFKIEILLYCPLSDLDEFEIIFVKKYMSTDRNFGYNILEGGKGFGKKVILLSEEHRSNLSKPKSTTGIPNIHYIKDLKTCDIIGYKVMRIQDGKEYTKTFRHKKYSLEENLEFAKQWLEKLKSGNVDNSKLNKVDQLPTHIYYKKIKGQIIGYMFKINRSDFKIERTFSSLQISMEKKLELAIKSRDSILADLRKNDKINQETGVEQSAGKRPYLKINDCKSLFK
jgi:group I intron endonuclease